MRWPESSLVLGPADAVVNPREGGRGVEVISGGEVVVRDGRIVSVGPAGEADTSGLPRVRLEGKCLTPGLIDCHTHAVFAGWRFDEFELRQRGASYAEIMAAGGGIVSTVSRTRAAGESELARRTAGFLRTFARRGVSTVEIKSGYGLDLDTELRCLRAARDAAAAVGMPVVTTYMGAHAVPSEWKGDPDGYVSFVVSTVLPAVAEGKLAQFCDVFCERGAFSVEQSRRVLIAARALGLGLRVHADELAASGGARLAAEVRAVSAEHLLWTEDEDIRALAEAGVAGVLLPGTSQHLGERFARGREMLDMGVTVAVATDFNPGSSPLLDLRLAMHLAATRLGMTFDEVLCAVTVNAARALGLGRERGRLAPGYRADVAVWNVSDWRHLVAVVGDDPLAAAYADGRLIAGGEW